MTLHLYGASDDLIEARGDVVDEVDCWSFNDAVAVTCSDGTTIGFRLGGSAVWSADIITAGAGSTIVVLPARGEDEGDDEHGCPGYSDRVDITAAEPIASVVVGRRP
jgi:hypothetical protein